MNKSHPPTAKSPQEKKALSYANDRRNVFDGSNKAARTAVPARKAGENRKSRRKAAQTIKSAATADDATLDVVESSLRHDIERVGGWKKTPDEPLGELLKQKRLRPSSPNERPGDD